MRLALSGAMVCAAVAIAACGKAREGDTAPLQSGALEAQEILATNAGNMYDVIRLRRPSWLRRSGARPTSLAGPAAEIMVYLDGQRYGEIAALARLSATSVQWAEYLSPSEAQARFGQGNLGGVIHVHSHGTPPRRD